MRALLRPTRLFRGATLAVLLATALVALPVAGVVACPVEQFDEDGPDDGVREVELAALRPAESTPAPRETSIQFGEAPSPALALHTDANRTSPLSPFGDARGSRLRR